MATISIEQQIENFKTGFPFLKVIAPATPKRGISVLTPSQQSEAIREYDDLDGKIVKFVPASGAASRMFKDLFEGLALLESSNPIPSGSPAERFFTNLEKFPFYSEELFKGKSELEILKTLLGAEGLNYGALPKGQILFHKYDNETRTAFEEHLVEGALYASKRGEVNIHFTVSQEHLPGFENLFSEVHNKYHKRFGSEFNLSFSVQSPDTDMIAVNEDNSPFLDEHGNPLFRPGGHGALLHNLSGIKGDVIVLKNIDNVVNELFIEETIRWKKILIGELHRVRNQLFSYLRALDSEMPEVLNRVYPEIIEFLEKEFCITLPNLPKDLLHEMLRAKLNRPLRICGMVKNEGEPGGGPFIVYDADGSTSLQILEGIQLDPTDPNTKELLAASTHFNPVDIVCSTINYKGEQFDLSLYTDPMTGMIASKSYQGRKLKAQELPGLWNGSMSNWNTIFVETPLITFNPVKTLLDLLRKEHLG